MAEFSVNALEAKYGDCLLIQWGARNSNLVLIDGGPSSIYDDRIEPVLGAIRADLGLADDDPLELELVAVSHIDGDHILGVEQLLKAIRTQRDDNLPETVSIKRFWLNAFEEIVTGGGAMMRALPASLGQKVRSENKHMTDAVLASVDQGRRARDLARGLQLPGNLADATLIRSGMKLDLPEDLSITVLAPDSAELDALKTKWEATPASAEAELAEYIDDSVPNLSSLVMLIERNGKTALFTGDARGDLIIEALENAGLVQNDTFECDLLKVQHHGSKNNMEPEFFETVLADTYVISANGHHSHPSVETLEALMEARAGDSYSVVLTNPVPHIVTLLEAAMAKPEHQFVMLVRDDASDFISIDLG